MLPPPRGPPVGVSSLGTTAALFLPGPLLSEDPNTALSSAAALISCIPGIGLIATLLLINLYEVQQEQSLGTSHHPRR